MIERRQKETDAWNFVASVIVNQHRETSGSALQSKKWLLRDRLAFGEFWHLPVASCIVNLVRGERELADHGTAWTNLSSASLSTKLFSFLGCTFTTFMFLSKSKKNNIKLTFKWQRMRELYEVWTLHLIFWGLTEEIQIQFCFLIFLNMPQLMGVCVCA